MVKLFIGRAHKNNTYERVWVKIVDTDFKCGYSCKFAQGSNPGDISWHLLH